MKETNVAIVLAAGQGKRMNSSQKKQYLLIEGRPILFYSLETFEKSSFISAVILVTGEGEEDYVRKQIIDYYGFHKVKAIVTGGRERYHSVACGLKAIAEIEEMKVCDYVFIHDAARPFLGEAILERAMQCVREYKACVVGMPVKDTIKIADTAGFVTETPNRDLLWAVQTPQVFSYSLVREAYEHLLQEEELLIKKGIRITDDAMIVETFTDNRVKLVSGDYKNIKITTPEDLQIAQAFKTFPNVVDTKKQK